MIHANDVNAYIKIFPEATQLMLEAVRTAVKKAAPAAAESISYGMPAYKLNGIVVYFAGYKNHIGFYPGAAAIIKFRDEVSDYKNAKGSVQFPLNRPVPIRLITKIIKFKLDFNLQRINLKKKTKAVE